MNKSNYDKSRFIRVPRGGECVWQGPIEPMSLQSVAEARTTENVEPRAERFELPSF